MERAECHRHSRARVAETAKGGVDMQRRTRRSTSTMGGAAPDTIIGRAAAARAGARPAPQVRKHVEMCVVGSRRSASLPHAVQFRVARERPDHRPCLKCELTGDSQRRKASISPPSTVITWPVVLLNRFVNST